MTCPVSLPPVPGVCPLTGPPAGSESPEASRGTSARTRQPAALADEDVSGRCAGEWGESAQSVCDLLTNTPGDSPGVARLAAGGVSDRPCKRGRECLAVVIRPIRIFGIAFAVPSYERGRLGIPASAPGPPSQNLAEETP